MVQGVCNLSEGDVRGVSPDFNPEKREAKSRANARSHTEFAETFHRVCPFGTSPGRNVVVTDGVDHASDHFGGWSRQNVCLAQGLRGSIERIIMYGFGMIHQSEPPFSLLLLASAGSNSSRNR